MADPYSTITAVDLFKQVAPELVPSPADDTVIDLYLDLAAHHVAPGVFGDTYKAAVVYYAAHLASMASRGSASGGSGGAVGPIIAERAGEVSVNYGFSNNAGGAAASGTGLDNTAYGRMFIALRRTRVGQMPLSSSQQTGLKWPK